MLRVYKLRVFLGCFIYPIRGKICTFASPYVYNLLYDNPVCRLCIVSVLSLSPRPRTKVQELVS